MATAGERRRDDPARNQRAPQGMDPASGVRGAPFAVLEGEAAAGPRGAVPAAVRRGHGRAQFREVPARGDRTGTGAGALKHLDSNLSTGTDLTLGDDEDDGASSGSDEVLHAIEKYTSPRGRQGSAAGTREDSTNGPAAGASASAAPERGFAPVPPRSADPGQSHGSRGGRAAVIPAPREEAAQGEDRERLEAGRTRGNDPDGGSADQDGGRRPVTAHRPHQRGSGTAERGSGRWDRGGDGGSDPQPHPGDSRKAAPPKGSPGTRHSGPRGFCARSDVRAADEGAKSSQASRSEHSAPRASDGPARDESARSRSESAESEPVVAADLHNELEAVAAEGDQAALTELAQRMNALLSGTGQCAPPGSAEGGTSEGAKADPSDSERRGQPGRRHGAAPSVEGDRLWVRRRQREAGGRGRRPADLPALDLGATRGGKGKGPHDSAPHPRPPPRRPSRRRRRSPASARGARSVRRPQPAQARPQTQRERSGQRGEATQGPTASSRDRRPERRPRPTAYKTSPYALPQPSQHRAEGGRSGQSPRPPSAAASRRAPAKGTARRHTAGGALAGVWTPPSPGEEQLALLFPSPFAERGIRAPMMVAGVPASTAERMKQCVRPGVGEWLRADTGLTAASRPTDFCAASDSACLCESG